MVNPVIACPNEAKLRWFLERTGVSLVYCQYFPSEVLCDRDVSSILTEIDARDLDVCLTTPDALRKVCPTLDSSISGDVFFFANGRLVTKLADERPRSMDDLLRDLFEMRKDSKKYFANKRMRRKERFLEALRRARSGVQSRDEAHDGYIETASAYEVLGVHERATWQEIKAAYRARLAQYHPDKVPQWLGNKFKSFAECETKRIIQAYKPTFRRTRTRYRATTSHRLSRKANTGMPMRARTFLCSLPSSGSNT